ncbi:MAG TPA: hypothetical protein VGP72_22185 [Planctomycetota bacterium]
MADCKVAKARKRLQVLAEGVAADELELAAGNIVLGCLGCEQEVLAEALSAEGLPRLAIGAASIGFSGGAYPLVVETLLTVPLPGGAQDLANIDNLISALRAAWLNSSSYPEGEVVARSCEFEPSEVESRGDLTIVRTRLFVAFENPDV